jgi:hypothetical protein
MGEVNISSPGCPARQELLAAEHAARLLIREAETPGKIPIEQLVNFQACQRNRWAHEHACSTCAAELGVASA